MRRLRPRRTTDLRFTPRDPPAPLAPTTPAYIPVETRMIHTQEGGTHREDAPRWLVASIFLTFGVAYTSRTLFLASPTESITRAESRITHSRTPLIRHIARTLAK